VRVVGLVTERDQLRAVAVGRPEEIPGLAEQYDVIGIDEVQFFPQEIVLTIDALVERGKRVVASGLDQDFRGLPFVKDGRPLGIVSLRLLARWAFDESVQRAQ
jgi:thymidine kinase